MAWTACCRPTRAPRPTGGESCRTQRWAAAPYSVLLQPTHGDPCGTLARGHAGGAGVRLWRLLVTATPPPSPWTVLCTAAAAMCLTRPPLCRSAGSSSVGPSAARRVQARHHTTCAPLLPRRSPRPSAHPAHPALLRNPPPISRLRAPRPPPYPSAGAWAGQAAARAGRLARERGAQPAVCRPRDHLRNHHRHARLV